MVRMVDDLWYLVPGCFFSSGAAAHSNSNVYSRCPPPQPEAATTTATTTSDKLPLVLVLSWCWCWCWCWCWTFEDGCCGGLWYLLPATWYAAEYLCMYACFSQDDPCYLVSRPFNITKLRELGTAFNTTSGGEWRCYLHRSETPSVSKSKSVEMSRT